MKSRIVLLVLALAGSLNAADPISLPLPSPGNVTLSLDEYNKLVELAAKPVKLIETPPLPYALKHAEIKLGLENETAIGTLQVQGEVFRKGIIKVPLTSGITLLDAHQGSDGIPLDQENGTQSALLRGPSEFSVDLDTAIPLRIDAGRASLNLPVPSAGSVQLAISIPGDHTLVNISPGVITARKSENGKTAVEATLVPGQTTTIWWATREAPAPVTARENRFLTDIKTLVSVSEAEFKLAALADVSVVQGEPQQFELEVPSGYEITGVTGPSLESSEMKSGALVLKLSGPVQRSYQFLITMERSVNGSKADVSFLGFKNAQRETGEVLVEGAGTIQLTANEAGTLKRMDVKETNPYLRSLAHFPPQAAFRYHRQPNETSSLALEWVRYPDSSVLAAVAEHAEVTTLVTSEGKSLTEVKLTIKNQAQPFLKVELPAGVNILSAEVAGEKVKPAQAPDGSRVPLLRPGLRTSDAYEVSFVFIHPGVPFARKGGSELSLPKMDIPISVLDWELFLPERYKVKDFAGDALPANVVHTTIREGAQSVNGTIGAIVSTPRVFDRLQNFEALVHGQIGGVVVDPSGAVIPNARVNLFRPDTGETFTTNTDESGRWAFTNQRSGPVRITADAQGFKRTVQALQYDKDQPREQSTMLGLGNASETVEVTAEGGEARESRDEKKKAQAAQLAPSVNVVNLQRRVAGVLPVAIDVPRAGTSFRFVRPLVLDEETKLSFNYKSR